MKKLMMIAAMMLMSVGAFAQEAGKMAIGVDANYGIKKDASRLGAGAKFQYSITDDFRAEAKFIYYPKKDYSTVWNGMVNVQYLIPCAENLYVYPQVGVGLMGESVDILGHSVSETLFEFHGGAGIEYFVSDNIKLNFDAIYQYGKKNDVKFDWPLLSLGIAYVF
ncbi:MAG: porin family protein [Prevotella sp.]|nr:porin family protein [Prevotella sp.]